MKAQAMVLFSTLLTLATALPLAAHAQGNGQCRPAASANLADVDSFSVGLADDVAAQWGLKSRKLIVILWDPGRPDHPAPDPKAVDRMLFGQSPSVADYFRDQSGGRASLHKAEMTGWIHAKKPADHYWNHPADARDGFTDGHTEKWTEALDEAAKTIDFASYDTNHNGVLDPDEAGVLIVIPQNGPFGTNRPPLRAQIPYAIPLWEGGVRIPVIAEVYLGSPINMPVAAHELSHLFWGMPDMYGNNAHPGEAAGPYSLMDVSYQDAQYDAVNKLRQGWVTAETVNRGGSYTVKSVETSERVLKIERPGSNPPEFIVIENRQRGRYDTQIPDTGLAIWDALDVPDWGGKYRRVSAPGKGDQWRLWHDVSGGRTELRWMDGTPSGIFVKKVSGSGESMQLELEFANR